MTKHIITALVLTACLAAGAQESVKAQEGVKSEGVKSESVTEQLIPGRTEVGAHAMPQALFDEPSAKGTTSKADKTSKPAMGTTSNTDKASKPSKADKRKGVSSVASVSGAPFKIKEFKVPTFRNVEVRVSADDLSADGKITPAINEKIAALSKQGGGVVVVPKGHWLAGRIELKSNVRLHLCEGAVVEFSADIEDYLPAVFTRHEGVEVMGAGAFIYANGAKNIALTGRGVIMGPPMGCEMRLLKNGNSVVENDIDYRLPVSERLCDGQEGRTFYRPKSFSPINCKNVLVEGVTFERSVLWNVNPTYCDGVILRGVTVNSINTPSGDGIDISSCSNVLIEYCTLNCGDDCFTLKSGRCEDGLRVNRPTENVIIRHCLAREGHGGITCGSETAGGIRNVYLHNCVFDGTRTGFRFKTRRNRGGTTEKIFYENIRLIDVREAFTWDLLGSPMYMGELARRNPPLDITPLTPTVKDITISNFIIESADRMISINGIPEIPAAGVVIERGRVSTNRIIKTMNDADGIVFRNLEIQATDNQLTFDDSRNVVFDNVVLHVPTNSLNIDMIGPKTGNIIIKNNDSSRLCTQGNNLCK